MYVSVVHTCTNTAISIMYGYQLDTCTVHVVPVYIIIGTDQAMKNMHVHDAALEVTLS